MTSAPCDLDPKLQDPYATCAACGAKPGERCRRDPNMESDFNSDKRFGFLVQFTESGKVYSYDTNSRWLRALLLGALRASWVRAFAFIDRTAWAGVSASPALDAPDQPPRESP
jgi:hypothetical protein